MKKHIGSTIALVLGVLLLITGLTKPSGLLVAGPVIILGALAYRSAKKRILGDVKNSLLRKCLELSAIIAIIAAVLFQNDLATQIETDPFPNLIIPLWVIIAYMVIALKRKKNVEEGLVEAPHLNNQNHSGLQTPISESGEKNTNYFIRHWRGELSLPVSYWVNGLLALIAAYAIFTALGFYLNSLSYNYATMIYWIVALLVTVIITIWQIVGIWRSSDRYTETTSPTFWAWGGVAKIMVVIGMLNTIGEINRSFIPGIKEGWDLAVMLDDLDWNIQLVGDGKELKISGGIGYGIYEQFATVLSAAPSVEIIHVNLGHGGLIKEAKKMQSLIYERKLSTYVSTECVSACTIVFLGGKYRYLKSGALLGFHSYIYPGLTQEDTNNFYDDKKYLRDLGISNEFIEKIFNTPKDEMWYPTNDELTQANVIDLIISGNKFTQPDLGTTINSEIEEGIELMENVKNATTIEEGKAAVKLQHERAVKNFALLKERAKSPDSIAFILLLEKQNMLAQKVTKKAEQVQHMLGDLMVMDLETTNEVESEKQTKLYIHLCELDKSYILDMKEFLELINEKIELAKKPIIAKELNKTSVSTLNNFLIRGRDIQAEILEGEEEAYRDLYCDQLLDANQ